MLHIHLILTQVMVIPFNEHGALLRVDPLGSYASHQPFHACPITLTSIYISIHSSVLHHCLSKSFNSCVNFNMNLNDSIVAACQPFCLSSKKRAITLCSHSYSIMFSTKAMVVLWLPFVILLFYPLIPFSCPLNSASSYENYQSHHYLSSYNGHGFQFFSQSQVHIYFNNIVGASVA